MSDQARLSGADNRMKAARFRSPCSSRGGSGQFQEIEFESGSGERHVLRFDFPCSRVRLVRTLREFADRVESSPEAEAKR